MVKRVLINIIEIILKVSSKLVLQNELIDKRGEGVYIVLYKVNFYSG